MGKSKGKKKNKKQKEVYSWSGVDGNVDTKGRYLCVSNGYEIWCLDLKQSKRWPGAVPLPKISSLDLMGDEHLPASVGLFNWGSNSYMIGGQHLPNSLKEPLDPWSEICWGEFPSPLALNRYKSLCASWGISGSSRLTRRLALAEADGTFSASKASEFTELGNPKVWPIVELINGELHVMDTVPFYLEGPRDWIFSHEVSNLNNDDDDVINGLVWEDIPTIDEKQHINSHVVVGDLIFAVTHEGSEACYYLEFNSMTRKWRGCTEIKPEWKSAFELKHVWNVLAIGAARCVGEFPSGSGGLEPVFVLIAVVKNYALFESMTGTQAVAYLVTKTGRVICHQHVPDFFKGPSLCPCMVIACAMIHVDGGVDGAMCSVVSGTLHQEGGSKNHLFVNTFSVEMLECAALKVREILVKKASEGEEVVSPAVELEFVRVDVKDKFIYETDNTMDIDLCPEGQFVGWQACFVTPGPPLMSNGEGSLADDD